MIQQYSRSFLLHKRVKKSFPYFFNFSTFERRKYGFEKILDFQTFMVLNVSRLVKHNLFFENVCLPWCMTQLICPLQSCTKFKEFYKTLHSVTLPMITFYAYHLLFLMPVYCLFNLFLQCLTYLFICLFLFVLFRFFSLLFVYLLNYFHLFTLFNFN